jgi:hypothetical protein
LFWLAHSGLSTLIFSDGYGPTQEYRHLPFSGPIQVSRRHYSVMAVGPFKNIDNFVLVGPLGIIDIDIQRWLWAHPGISTSPLQWAHSGFSATVFSNRCGPIQEYCHLCFGRPTHNYRHQYLTMAMGPPRIIDISPSVGPFRFLGDTIRPWLWAHSRILTSLFWLAHSGLSTLIFGDGYGPTQEYQHLPFSGPIQVSRRHYSAMAVGPFKNIDIFVLVGPLGIIDINIQRWLWAHPGISTFPL